jgi:hypothetical protein
LGDIGLGPCRNPGTNFGELPFRNCPKRGMSSAPSVDLAPMRRPKWVERSLICGLWGHTLGTSQAFRTVSPRTWVNKGYLRGPGRSEKSDPDPVSCPLRVKTQDRVFCTVGVRYFTSSEPCPRSTHYPAGPSGTSIIVTAVLNSTSVARRSPYILCFSHLGGT